MRGRPPRESYRPVEERARDYTAATCKLKRATSLPYGDEVTLPVLRATDALVPLGRTRRRFNRLKFSRTEASQIVTARTRCSLEAAGNLGKWEGDTRPRSQSGAVAFGAAVPIDGCEMPQSRRLCRHTRQRLLAHSIHASLEALLRRQPRQAAPKLLKSVKLHQRWFRKFRAVRVDNPKFSRGSRGDDGPGGKLSCV
jgi:hypothetical protein